MTKTELQNTIKDIEGGIASPSVPEKFKANMRSQLEMLKGKLAEMSKPSAPVKPKATSTPTEKRSVMNDLRGTKKPDADRETAMSLMDIYSDAEAEFDVEYKEQLLSNQEKQEKFIKYLNKKILPTYKKDGLSENIHDILEDENYHGLNEYLGLSGLFGSESQKYYLTFMKKHGGVDWQKKQLNPKYFGLEAEAEETDEKKKKGVPLPKDKQSNDDDYDCDELIEKEKTRRAKAKERASKPKKTEATKNTEKLEKVFDNVKERAIEEDITKSELEKLISSTEDLLKLLKDKLAKLK